MKKKSISNYNNDNDDKYNDTNDDDQLTYPETSNVMQNWCKYCQSFNTVSVISEGIQDESLKGD